MRHQIARVRKQKIKPTALKGSRILQSNVDGSHLRCLRCEHLWKPKKDTITVRQCPHCKSAYWDVPYGEESLTNRYIAHERARRG